MSSKCTYIYYGACLIAGKHERKLDFCYVCSKVPTNLECIGLVFSSGIYFFKKKMISSSVQLSTLKLSIQQQCMSVLFLHIRELYVKDMEKGGLPEHEQQLQVEAAVTEKWNSFETETKALIDRYHNGTAHAGGRILSSLQTVIEGLKQEYEALVSILLSKVKDWRRNQQRIYGLMAKYQCQDLDLTAQSCAKCGEQLYDRIRRLDNVLQSISQGVRDDLKTTCSNLSGFLWNLFLKLLQGTFVVSDQAEAVLKTVNKKSPLPNIAVRLLAADDLKVSLCDKVRAHFCFEGDLSKIWSSADHQKFLSGVSNCSQKIIAQGGTQMFKKSGKSKDAFIEATFKNVKWDFKSFERKGNEKGNENKVHKEKYRLVFETEVSIGTRKEILWTLSLPLVVITGTNQGCAALGSLLWQCFSGDDVFLLPFQTREKLQWPFVVAMLTEKLSVLGKRDISPEAEKFWAERLRGMEWAHEGNLDQKDVYFDLFCTEKPHDYDAPFWMWFLSIYNFIADYVKEEWIGGLIEFISKEAAEDLLYKCANRTDKMFILRFSASYVHKNRQGVGSLYGGICGAVLVQTDVLGKKRETVNHIDAITKDDLEKKTLLEFMRDSHGYGSEESVYGYSYPSGTPREEAFKKFVKASVKKVKEESSTGARAHGYTKVKTTHKVQLPVSEFSALNLSDCQGGEMEELKHKGQGETPDRPKRQARRKKSLEQSTKASKPPDYKKGILDHLNGKSEFGHNQSDEALTDMGAVSDSGSSDSWQVVPNPRKSRIPTVVEDPEIPSCSPSNSRWSETSSTTWSPQMPYGRVDYSPASSLHSPTPPQLDKAEVPPADKVISTNLAQTYGGILIESSPLPGSDDGQLCISAYRHVGQNQTNINNTQPVSGSVLKQQCEQYPNGLQFNANDTSVTRIQDTSCNIQRSDGQPSIPVPANQAGMLHQNHFDAHIPMDNPLSSLCNLNQNSSGLNIPECDTQNIQQEVLDADNVQMVVNHQNGKATLYFSNSHGKIHPIRIDSSLLCQQIVGCGVISLCDQSSSATSNDEMETRCETQSDLEPPIEEESRDFIGGVDVHDVIQYAHDIMDPDFSLKELVADPESEDNNIDSSGQKYTYKEL